jgi:nucleoside-diphosphate-sugar epimerase
MTLDAGKKGVGEMASLKVLFIGGTGIISSACAELAVERGLELTVLNRGETSKRTVPAGARVLHGDIRDEDAARSVLEGHDFDVVVDFVAFTEEHVATDVKLFRDRVRQYVFISSASVYLKPVVLLPIRESTALRNPYWQYSRDKIAAEEYLTAEFREHGFPVTIVRPSHTYDRTTVPLTGGWTDVERMRRGDPVVVHGDGTSLWVLTHHADFARAFVPCSAIPKPSAMWSTSRATRCSPGIRSIRRSGTQPASSPSWSMSPPITLPAPCRLGERACSATKRIR